MRAASGYSPAIASWHDVAMLRSTPALTALLPLLGGCVINIGGDDEADDQASGEADSSSDAESSSGSTSSTTTMSTSSTDDDVGTSSDDATNDTSSETGGELCGIEPGDAPWITLSQDMMDIVEGSPVRIVCGGQGSFMIRFDVAMGGFMPSDPEVPVHVTLDVEGYNLGPSGHFGEFDYTIFGGCCSEDYNSPDYCYYDPLLVTLFPPDQIPDLTVLHELPATLTISMSADGTLVEPQTIAVQMWAMDDGSWNYCNYGYGYTSGYGGTGYGGTGGYGTGGLAEPPLELALPIPL